ncbi:O-antigen polymerase [Aeromonas caviae]|uniref:O-antigen polymerase n=1 Tax=Aeromonas caviae TaxID=648 RepID=UPI003F7426E7
MNNVDFHLSYYENVSAALVFLIISYVLTYLFVRKQIYSIFDPLFFNFLMAGAGYSVVFYLSYFNMISDYYLYSFCLTQGAFFLGINTFKLPCSIAPNVSHTTVASKKLYDSVGYIKCFYYLSFFCFFVSQMIVYYYNGLPIFLDSRLSIFSGGSGLGFLSRIIYVTSTITLTTSSYALIFRDYLGIPKLAHRLQLLFYIIVAVFSGSKGALLVMIFIMSLMLFFSRKINSDVSLERKATKLLLKILFLVFPAAIFTVFVQTGFENVYEVVLAIAMRFVHTGQIFYMVYPNDVLFEFPAANGFIALFRDVLGAWRIISWDELPINHGLLAFQYHYALDLLTGPNDRHNTFGLFYFGFWGAIIFSYLIGFTMGFIRNKLYHFFRFNLITVNLYVLLNLAANNLNQDPSGMAVGYFHSIGIVFTLLIVISFLIYRASKRDNY